MAESNKAAVREGGGLRHSINIERPVMKLITLSFSSFVVALGALSCESAILAQEVVPAPTKSAGTPQILPRPDFHFDGNVGRTYLESDTPPFPHPVRQLQDLWWVEAARYNVQTKVADRREI